MKHVRKNCRSDKFGNQRWILVTLLFSCFLVTLSTGQGLSGSSEDLRTLDSMTVHDRTEVEKLKSSAVNMYIIEGKDLIGRSVSLTDVLDRVAGVKVRNSGGLGSGQRISIRGLEGKRVRVFIDGAPITALDGMFGLDDLPIQLIERVEIYKGVIPARFGSDALGGAINIVTVERVFTYADFTYKPSSFNTHQAMLLSKACNPNGFYVGLGGILNYSDNNYTMNINPIRDGADNPALNNLKREHDKYRMNLIGMSIGKWDGWFDDIGTEIVYFGNKKEIQGINKPILDAHNYSHTFLIAPYIEKNDFFLNGLDLDIDLAIIGVLNKLIDTSSTVYSDWLKIPKTGSLYGETDIYSKHNSRDTLICGQARINLEYSINDHHRIDLNNLFQCNDMNPFDGKSAEGMHVSIAEYPARMYSNVLNAGYDLKLFADRLNNYFSAKLFSQRLSIDTSGVNSNENIMGRETKTKTSTVNGGIGDAISFQLTPQITLYTSYQHAARLPDENELFGDGVSVSQNLTLKPEKSENINIGCNVLVKRDELFFKKLELELSGFARYTKDLIRLESGQVSNLYKNIDDTRTLGFEIDIKIELFPWLYLTSNLTCQEMIYLKSIKEPFKEGKRLPNHPLLFGNAGIELSKENLIFRKSVAKLFWESDYTHEYYRNVKLGSNPKGKIPSQFMQNVGIQYSFNNSIDIGCEVHNIADIDAYDLYQTPLPGRSLHFILHYFVKKQTNKTGVDL